MEKAQEITSPEEMRRRLGAVLASAAYDGGLETGGGGGNVIGMNERVTRLEEWSKVATERLGRIETKVDALPNKTDLLTMVVATITTGVAIVGLIIGALAWIGDRTERAASPPSPAPVIIQMPPAAAPSK